MDRFWQEHSEMLKRDAADVLHACNKLAVCLDMPSVVWEFLTDISRYWLLAGEGAAAYARDPSDHQAYEKYQYYQRLASDRCRQITSLFSRCERWILCSRRPQGANSERDEQ
jgi:hypothetical protein